MATTTADRFDVFVGNVRDSTTEEQLQSVFSVVGKIDLGSYILITSYISFLHTTSSSYFVH